MRTGELFTARIPRMVLMQEARGSAGYDRQA